MEKVLSLGAFEELDRQEMLEVDGGLLGVAWLTGALLCKIFAGGVTLGVAGATAYFSTKQN